MSDMIDAVIFDFGGVLGLPQDPERAAAMASLCGLSLEQFFTIYPLERLELDRGTLPTEEYWGRIIRAGGITPDDGLIARIEREDALGWTRINDAMVEWAAELRSAGYRTAILSNMPVDKLAFMRESGRFEWIRDFDPAIFSCDFSLVKPEPAIYRLCLDRLGAAPARCLFLDDSAVNVEGARACGINALHFGTAADSVGELRQRWGLPVGALKGEADG
jgi:putative hydrolase of the HAD superfamily